jgi:hypothetical protein
MAKGGQPGQSIVTAGDGWLHGPNTFGLGRVPGSAGIRHLVVWTENHCASWMEAS